MARAGEEYRVACLLRVGTGHPVLQIDVQGRRMRRPYGLPPT